MLRLEDHWVWDSWVVDDGQDYHLFHLKSPRTRDGVVSRHTRAVIGHASSPDLVAWTVHPDALHPDPDGWDDLSLWTGSVVRDDDGCWWLHYTAISTRGRELDQRLGAAVSDDLVTWRRVGPVAAIDPAAYRTVTAGRDDSETWRDPFVLRDPDGDGWHMLVTARAAGATPGDDGVLGHAWSADLESWEVRPPLSSPGAGFSQLEVAQVHEVDGRWLLVFTCDPEEQTVVRRSEHGDHCTWSVPGDSPLGPWDVAAARPFTAVPRLFAAPLVRRRDGSWCLLGFLNHDAAGIDTLEILDPIPVTTDAEGYLIASRVPSTS